MKLASCSEPNTIRPDGSRTVSLVPGLLKDKVLALLKSLHQKPRARLVPRGRAAPARHW